MAAAPPMPGRHSATTAERADAVLGVGAADEVLAPPDDAPLPAFHVELRDRNLPVLLWCGIVFNVAYLAWTLFDIVLAPDHWERFFAYRLVAVVVNTAVVAAVHHPRLRHRTWEAFWIWLFVWGLFIAPMLPVSGRNFAPYVMGFTIILFGAGLLPFWPFRWALANVAAVVAAGGVAFALIPSDVAGTDLLGGLFFVATAAGLALVSARFRYTLARNDYRSRHQLAAALERETEATARLDAMATRLQNALERLEEHDRLKSKFFANISHELRTPLALIMAPVEDLAMRLADPGLRRPLDVVRSNAQRLLRLIDELLDLSRLDAGHLRLDLAEVDLAGLARAVVENATPAALAADIALELDSGSRDAVVFGDAHRLETILTNLVANALRYTPSGGAVRVGVLADDERVSVTVTDTGPGIAPEHLERIFERFYRAADDGGGAGIGLSLARELAELHGGELTAESLPGEGSSFRLRIPLGRGHVSEEVVERRRRHDPTAPRRRADDVGPEGEPTALEATAATTPPVPILPRVRRSRILVAEDNADMREFIAGLLRLHHEVGTAADGTEAWRLIRRAPPDLLVSDVMMPGMSGTQLCRAVKDDPGLRTTPVILLTARIGSEATLEGYASGADDFVAKPFHPQVLLARVTAQLRLRELTFQLADQERFAAVGTLAAGILHEVRNPVNAILNGARVLADGTPDEATAAELVRVVLGGAERIQAITSALEEHARPAEDGGPPCCDPREGLDSTLALLGHRLGDVRIERRYRSRRAAAVPAGPLNQVLMNLLDNALRTGASTLELTVEDDGERIRIVVRDDGPGVPAALAGRIFEPFFTTRDIGEGSGLGLYLSRRLIEASGGALELDRTAAVGAAFVITLPAVPEPAAGAGADADVEPRPGRR